MSDFRIAILISGRGSNMEALLSACAEDGYPASAVVVISNRHDAAGLKTARDAGVPTEVLNHKDFDGRESFEDALDEVIRRYEPDLICLAGFMRILTAGFMTRWPDKIVNIHPSLLPAYRGLDTHGRVIADGVRFTGATVHFVRPEMDAGPIIAQAVVPVRQDDTPDTLAARVLTWEHRIFPLAVKLIAQGKVKIADESVHIDGEPLSLDGMINPSFE